MVCTPPQKLASPKNTKNPIKSIKMKLSKKKTKKSLDYVLKNIPAKFGDHQSILRQRKLGIMNLTDRQADFFFTGRFLVL